MERLHNEKPVITHQELNEDEEPPSQQQFISEEEMIHAYIQERLDRDKASISQRSSDFIHQFFPEATEKDWFNWRWQLKNSVRTTHQLSRFIDLSDNEIRPDHAINNSLPIRITPYYLSLLDRDNPEQPLR